MLGQDTRRLFRLLGLEHRKYRQMGVPFPKKAEKSVKIARSWLYLTQSPTQDEGSQLHSLRHRQLLLSQRSSVPSEF